MNRKILENYIGKNIEIMLMPDIPKTSGIISRCEDDYFVIGNELWAYSAILGIKPLKDIQPIAPAHVKTPKVHKIPEIKEENISADSDKNKTETQNEEIHIEENHENSNSVTLKTVEPSQVFEGVLVQFFPEKWKMYGFIVSEELKGYDVHLQDNERIFVHFNQITDEALREKLLNEQNHQPMIEVTFKLSSNEKGAVADDVREKKIADSEPEIIPETETEEPKLIEFDSSKRFEGVIVYFAYEENDDNEPYGFISCPELRNYDVKLRDKKIKFYLNKIEDGELRGRLMREKKIKPMLDVTFSINIKNEKASAYNVRSIENPQKNVLQIDMMSALSEEGEIEFFRRYEDVPSGQIRVKGNKFYTFYEDDVIDPMLAVFLEYSPSAEGQPVRFVKTMNKHGKIQAVNVEASAPFPEERVKAWEKEGLIEKAKARMGLSTDKAVS